MKGPQAVIGNDIPTKDRVIEFRCKLGGAQSVAAGFDDRKFTQGRKNVAFRQSPGTAHPTKSRVGFCALHLQIDLPLQQE